MEPPTNGGPEMTFATTDLSDAHPEAQVCDPVFQAYGGRTAFSGPITTLKVFEDNSMVREIVQTPGEGRVPVGGRRGARRRADRRPGAGTAPAAQRAGPALRPGRHPGALRGRAVPRG